MENNRICNETDCHSKVVSATSNESAKSSNVMPVIPMEGNSADSTVDGDQFFKRPARSTASRDFKTTLQYNDLEDHLSQRAHSIGIGLFNTDEIDDLPPRHREKVKKVYKKIVEFANTVIPQDALKTSHGGPIQVADLLALEVPGTARNRNQSEAGGGQSLSRSRTSSYRSDAAENETHKSARNQNHSEARGGGSHGRGRTSSNRSEATENEIHVSGRNSDGNHTRGRATEEGTTFPKSKFKDESSSDLTRRNHMDAEGLSIKNNSLPKKNALGKKNAEPKAFNNKNKTRNYSEESSNEVISPANNIKDDSKNDLCSSSSFHKEHAVSVPSKKHYERKNHKPEEKPVGSRKNHHQHSFENDSEHCDKNSFPKKYGHEEKPRETHHTTRNERRPDYKGEKVNLPKEAISVRENKVETKDCNSRGKFHGSSASLNSLNSNKSDGPLIFHSKDSNESNSERYSANKNIQKGDKNFTPKVVNSKRLTADDGHNCKDSKSTEKVSKRTNSPHRNECNFSSTGKNQRSNFSEGNSLRFENSEYSNRPQNQGLNLEKELKDGRSSSKCSPANKIEKSPQNKKPPFKRDKRPPKNSESNAGLKSEKHHKNSLQNVESASENKIFNNKSHEPRTFNQCNVLGGADSFESLTSKSSVSETRSESSKKKDGSNPRKFSSCKDEINVHKNFHKRKESEPKQNEESHINSVIDSRPQVKDERLIKNKKFEDVASKEYSKGSRSSTSSTSASLESVNSLSFKNFGKENLEFNTSSRNSLRSPNCHKESERGFQNSSTKSPSKKDCDTSKHKNNDSKGDKSFRQDKSDSVNLDRNFRKHPTRFFERKNFSERTSSQYSNNRNLRDSEVAAFSEYEQNTDETKGTLKKALLSSDPGVLQHVISVAQNDLGEIKNESIDPEKEIKRWEDFGFFVNVNVSENSTSLEFWKNFFIDALNTKDFSVDYCCKFTESLILNFERKEAGLKAVAHLKRLKKKTKDLIKPHIICVSKLKTRLIRPCNCEKTIISGCLEYFNDFRRKYTEEHLSKIKDVKDELKRISRRRNSADCIRTLKETLYTLEAMLSVFLNQCRILYEAVESSKFRASSIQEVRLLKKRFSQECNSFQRGLPIYSEKHNILQAVRFHAVSIVIADTASGKSSQLAEYLLGPKYENGTIICTQPRKMAAISITNYVCGQLGCAVGKLVGYDVGTEKKYGEDTKILYMTDYALLKKILHNRRLTEVSHVIIDEAHERTLYTDLLLGLLKECVEVVPRLRVIITSATIDPAVFVNFFKLSEKALVKVPGRPYPVEEVWLEKSVEIGWNYVEACVKKSIRIHTEESTGDVLVFLTSPSEIDEAIIMFKDLCLENNTPHLLSLHGKTDLQEQLLILKSTSERKIIFATNAVETSLTIPGIKYVVDSGMAKELMYFPDKNKSCLMVTFINKSSAEQRKGRAGRTQPGVCYRMYSKKNYQDMPDRSTPEILKTNLSKALLKIYEFGIKPERFQFVETPPEESILKALDTLEQLGLVKNEELTKLGKKVVKLPVDPRLSKLVLLGVKVGIGFEMAVIAGLVSEAGRLFLRFEDNKVEADKKKVEFCQKTGDLCTFLEVYKRWMEIRRPDRYNWCVNNYINSRALNSAVKTMNEIFTCLHQDLSVSVSRKYNNAAFNSYFESIVFTCFSENLCIYSGHPKLGYSSPYMKESLYLHPSSALKYLKKDLPEFVVYSTLMQTTRNFLMDVTPIKKATLDKAYQSGTFNLQADVMKCLQIAPKTLGPFGESILVRHILGKGGCKIQNLELEVEKLTRSRNFKIDVAVDKGLIVIYVDGRYHEAVSKLIYDRVDGIYTKMAKEEDIVKMSAFSNICIGSSGRISEIIMPGEYRELVLENVPKSKINKVEETLRNHGDLLSFQVTELKNKSTSQINATFKRVQDAQSAISELAGQSVFSVKPNVYIEETVKSPLFRLRVSWCRSLSTGSGRIEFSSEADKVIASGRLTQNSVCINNHSICFKPSDISDKELKISNLPSVVDESMIEEEITEFLDGYVKVKNVHINRNKPPSVSEKDLEEVKKQLICKFSPFSLSNDLVIDVTYPEPKSNIWNAMVYFKNRRELEETVSKLENNIFINSFPAEIKEVAESCFPYKKDLYEALQSHILAELKKVKGSKLTVETLAKENLINLKVSCKSMRELETLQSKLIRILMGRTIECFGLKKFSFLFTLSGERFIHAISEETCTFISVDSSKKTVNIYGLTENCVKAEELICSRISSQKLNFSAKKTFDLKNSNLPSGFLKSLYEKYGLDLRKLVKDYKLEDVVLNLQKGSLTLYGSKKQLKLVEESLEEICFALCEAEQTLKSEDDKDSCAICLGVIPFDYYRLENCGHAFCKSCLLLQVKSSPVPVVCVHEDCGKDIFLTDIKKILALGDAQMKKNFYNSALQHFVNTNIGQVTYCPSPGCNMVCRVSTSSLKFHCPECNADICTQCQTLYHTGMTCEMFKTFGDDEDYSLKVWMQENSSVIKQCPKCSVVIEKASGCNHMECLNCHSHFCWLCLKLFPEGNDVYDHLPFCPKNQGAGD